MRRAFGLLLAVSLAIVGGPAFGAAPAGGVAAPPAGTSRQLWLGASGAAQQPRAVAVTLVTGDRVTVTPGHSGVRVEAARWPGRRVTFRTSYTAGGDVRVVPSDVPSTVDPALFDVSGLIRAGYRDSAPLIVQGSGAAGRPLSSIGAVAVSSAAGLGPSIAAGGTRVWLDAPVHAASLAAGSLAAADPAPVIAGHRLDRNLDQVGAPAAWAAGLSGAGVRVAVLDTGVDATHPDLAGRVAAAENFAGTPDVTDHNGHGTHVAALVAGSGAAAGGARRGVAFGATVLSGKVLDDRGRGRLSSIIAGMEWAVANGARVVNLSLSSDAATTGRDPLSLAVNALTAAHGVLFVASAGNRGPSPTTIGAPGAADAALTVGAVDARDRLADFSSRGPRLGDHAIKPDLTAPGVDIVSARAAGTSLGLPLGDRYTRLSGTSMSAPHVTGAAALLAQRRPEWTAGTLKSVLIGSAAAVAAGAFDVGSGRLDLTTAVPQRLFAPAPSVGFGHVSYPQAALPPVDRSLTVHNSSAAPTTVDLRADLRGPEGRPAPDGMLTVTPARLTVPAGGSATATVTLAVAKGGFGAFSGVVTASPAGGERGPGLRVPVGVIKESTRHLVNVRAVDREGTTPGETLVTLINLGDITASPPDPVLLAGGEAVIRVRPGFYTVTAALPTMGEGEPDPDLAAAPVVPAAPVVVSVAIATVAEVVVDRDVDVTLDARAARPLSAAVAGVATTPVDVHVFVAARDRAGNGIVLVYGTSAQDVVEGKLFVQPTSPPRRGRLELSSKWRLDTVGGGPTYDLVFAAAAFPATLSYVVPTDALARVSTAYRAPVGYREARFVFTDINPVSVAVLQPLPGATPQRRDEYVAAGRGRSWFQCVTVTVAEAGIGGYCQAPTEIRQRSTVEDTWLRAPLRTTAGVARSAEDLFIGMNDLGDDGGHAGSVSDFVFARQSYALYRDGVLLAEGANPLGAHEVPAGAAVFRLTRTVELGPDVLPLSTRVESSWTFRSVPPRAGRPPVDVPVLDVAVHIPADDENRVPPGSVTLELDAGRPVAFVSLELSTDDGVTWQRVALRPYGHGRYRAVVTVATGFISLRTSAADRDGNGFSQTIVRAFAVDG